jgi:hypothetical protein
VDLTHGRPGHRASLHSHAERSELFHFLDSGACLEIDGQIHRPAEHGEFLIEPGPKHRFWADDAPFRMLVVCFGEWSAEDQVRYEDDYGREGEKLIRTHHLLPYPDQGRKSYPKLTRELESELKRRVSAYFESRT